MQEQEKKQNRRVVKVVAISDTHSDYSLLNKFNFPPADIFIHAGDISNSSQPGDFYAFACFLDKLPYKHKVVIGGNHDFGLQASREDYLGKIKYFGLDDSYRIDNVMERELIKQHCHFLDHQYIEIEGIKIFGSPYMESSYLQGFSIHPNNAVELWNNVPAGLDILITHNPPHGIMDKVQNGNFCVGSKRLRHAVGLLEPKIHIFGHIHEGHGNKIIGNTHFYNVSMMDRYYSASHPPTIIQFQI